MGLFWTHLKLLCCLRTRKERKKKGGKAGLWKEDPSIHPSIHPSILCSSYSQTLPDEKIPAVGKKAHANKGTHACIPSADLPITTIPTTPHSLLRSPIFGNQHSDTLSLFQLYARPIPVESSLSLSLSLSRTFYRLPPTFVFVCSLLRFLSLYSLLACGVEI